MNVTQEDVQLLRDVSDQFSRNMIFAKEGAIKAFQSKLTAKDYFNILSAKISQSVPSHSAKSAAKKELKTSLAALPGLKRAFGEQAIIDALPNIAAKDRVIELCEALGALQISNYYKRKAPTK